MKAWFSFAAWAGLSLMALAETPDAPTPPENMQDHQKWAEAATTPAERIHRLEGFWAVYLPAEEGGKNPDMPGYGDGAHLIAVSRCGWQLAKAYVEAGEKEKALTLLTWLQRYDSRSQQEDDEGAPPLPGPPVNPSAAQPESTPVPEEKPADELKK